MKFVDATGFPVLPSGWTMNGKDHLYWYREDLRVARGNEDFWDSPRWMAVQALLHHPDYPRTRERGEWDGESGRIGFAPDTQRELAFEVGKDPHPNWPQGHYWPLRKGGA